MRKKLVLATSMYWLVLETTSTVLSTSSAKLLASSTNRYQKNQYSSQYQAVLTTDYLYQQVLEIFVEQLVRGSTNYCLYCICTSRYSSQQAQQLVVAGSCLAMLLYHQVLEYHQAPFFKMTHHINLKIAFFGNSFMDIFMILDIWQLLLSNYNFYINYHHGQESTQKEPQYCATQNFQQAIIL